MNHRRPPCSPPRRPLGRPLGPSPSTSWRLALAAVVVIALVSALHVARAVMLPIMLALVLSFLLSPIIRFLHHLRIPTVVGAALVVLSLITAIATAVLLLSGPAAEWLGRAPEVIEVLEEELRVLLEAVERVGEATQAGEGKLAVPDVFQRLGEALLNLTWQFVASAVVIVFLLYFLLASGDLFLRKLVHVLPTWRDKRRAVEVARRIQHDISRYLFTITVINTVLGLVVGSVLHTMGMPNPLLWGVMAGVLNFVPYLGPFITLSVLTAVALLTFPTAGEALLRPAAFFVLTTLEGQLITPLIVGRRLVLNPVVIFIGLIFWGWLWGVVGALLAVPITMMIKIICDAVPSLEPVGTFLSR